MRAAPVTAGRIARTGDPGGTDGLGGSISEDQEPDEARRLGESAFPFGCGRSGFARCRADASIGPNMYPNLKLQLWKTGIRQNRLAQLLGIHETLLSRILNGYREPDSS